MVGHGMLLTLACDSWMRTLLAAMEESTGCWAPAEQNEGHLRSRISDSDSGPVVEIATLELPPRIDDGKCRLLATPVRKRICTTFVRSGHN